MQAQQASQATRDVLCWMWLSFVCCACQTDAPERWLLSLAPSVITPATPQLIAAASSAFSPDGDQSAESVGWNVSADAATSFLRLRISRNNQALFGRLLPVTQAATTAAPWNGTDAAGRVVNNGAYSYAIEAVNRAGVASTSLRGYVEVQSAVRMVSVRRRQ